MDLDYLLSIDPGAHSAWVLWVRDDAAWTPTRHGRESAPTVVECRRLLGALLPDWSRAAVVVEGQYQEPRARAEAHGRRASPWYDVIALVESRCRWQHAAELAGATVEVAAPGTWIPAMTRGAPGETSKARIRWVVERLLPGMKLGRDEWDAAGLGAWWVQRMGGRVMRGGEE